MIMIKNFISNFLNINICIRLNVFIIIALHSMCISSPYYEAKLIIETTSDWTSIEFAKQKIICLDFTRNFDEGDRIRVKPFKIDKKPYDSTKVVTEYKILLPDAFYQNDTLVIKKGDIGYTKVQISDPNAYTILFWINDTNICDDPRNVKRFPISFRTLKEVGIYSKPIKVFRPSVEPLVLTFYYPWYKTWHRGGKQITRHTPKLGFYNSADTSVIISHIELAKNAGIDGFIISWFGIGSFTDSVAQIMIPHLEKNKLKFTIYLESCDSLKQFIDIKKYLWKYFFNSGAYLHSSGKPVLFIYERVPKKIRNELIPKIANDIFIISHGNTFSEINQNEGIHLYLPILSTSELDSINQLASIIAHYHNKIFVATVYPGFDNRPSRFPGVEGRFIDREGGNFYRGAWEAAMASNPDWVAIISFNEWGEATEIEPSLELGDQYLKSTKDYIAKFKKNRSSFNRN